MSFDLIETALIEALEKELKVESVAFDTERFGWVEKEGEPIVEFRYLEDSDILLVAVLLGQISRAPDPQATSSLLMSLNSDRALTRGGGVGVSAQTGELTLTRGFVIDEDKVAASLAGLETFVGAGKMLERSIPMDPQNLPREQREETQELTQMIASIADDSRQPEDSPEEDDSKPVDTGKETLDLIGAVIAKEKGLKGDGLTLFQEKLTAAHRRLGIEPIYMEELRSYTLLVGDEIPLIVTYDSIFREVVFLSVVGNVPEKLSAETNKELMEKNFYLAETGLMVFGTGASSDRPVMLSFTVSLDALGEDEEGVCNLINHIGAHAGKWKKSFTIQFASKETVELEVNRSAIKL